jgi:hypothetical protein
MEWLAATPPVVALLVAVLTRNVYWALGAAILLSETLLSAMNPAMGLLASIDRGAHVFSDGGNTRILLFCLIIGALIAYLERAKAFARWMSETGCQLRHSKYVYPYSLYLRVISQVAEGSARTGHEVMHAVVSQAYAELLLISAHPARNKRDPMGERCIEPYMNDLHDVWQVAAVYPQHQDMMRTRLLRQAAQLDQWDCWPEPRPNLKPRGYDHRKDLLQLIDPYEHH